MAQPDLKNRITELERLVEHGAIAPAQAIAEELCHKKLERRPRLRVANLARRCHRSDLAVALLHPIVRAPIEPSPPVTDDERAEYAASLNNLGAPREALQLLRQVDAAKAPHALLFQAYAHMWQWDWTSAVAPLETFAGRSGLPPDLHLWGLLNLGLALAHGPGKTASAIEAIDHVLHDTATDSFRMLHKNARLARLRVAFCQRDWPECHAQIRHIRSQGLDSDDPVYSSFAEMWFALVALGEDPKQTAALRRLRSVRTDALKAGQWENRRACDFYESELTGRRDLLVQLYFGSPYPALRKKLLALLTAHGIDTVPETFDWSFFEKPSPRAERIEAFSGRSSACPAGLEPGRAAQRLLEILASDFYKPFTLPELNERLNPNEYFNPRSSPDRIHQAISRLRKWTVSFKLPLQIELARGAYRLASASPGAVTLVLARERHEFAPPDVVSERLSRTESDGRAAFESRWFSAADYASRLGGSPATVQRYLRQCVDEGQLEKRGAGKATRYRFKATEKAKAKRR